MKHYGDITKIHGKDVPVVDVVVGGSPCQDLSSAGLHKGLAGSRSGLFMEQIRIIKEMRENDRITNGRTTDLLRPRYMLWENVVGAFSTNGGDDFRCVLEETARIVQDDAAIPRPHTGKWSNAGCILAKGWSIAWRVLDAQFWGVAQRRKRIALVADFGGHSASKILFESSSMRGHFEEIPKKRKTDSDKAQKGTREPDYTLLLRSGKEGGGKGALIQKDISATLSTLNRQALFQFDSGADMYSFLETGGVSMTLRSAATDATHIPCVIGSNFVKSKKAHSSDDDEIWIESDVAGTLNTFEISDTYTSCVNTEEIGEKYIVRKLTPLECERLQGFPDNWTDIGEYIDTTGKTRKTSDSARYKAIGNSIALPCWDYVMRGICNEYEETPTMASLFDGIGGFPLIWERINGKGFCLWASEIEEFPIAVTKKHFGED